MSGYRVARAPTLLSCPRTFSLVDPMKLSRLTTLTLFTLFLTTTHADERPVVKERCIALDELLLGLIEKSP